MPVLFTKQLLRLLMVSALLLTGAPLMSLEQPGYTVLYQQDGIEFREYESYLVTATFIENEEDYKAAANEGFKRLFRYITGDNANQTDIAMTAPVQQSRGGESMSMTMPVQNIRSGNGYSVSFVLPTKYTLETAPVPLDPRVQTVEIPGKTVAVISYSGRWTDKNFQRYQRELLAGLQAQNIDTQGEVVSAFYNSPFTLPMFRRNEVMVTVADLPEIVQAEKASILSVY
ncbi:heme-binding protein [Oceanicoccus sp. KOV_DT_Chl]|uniref:SOUL family heme-binding protein n=1 Tax=Oceanicoccus sp. KOV_DT_Chl TaxID=1904639 RepID=UPI000C7D3E63|nr:heme-binding protein [Oceanicoccus sp. KOV_DT_Chl]